jgi:hypothetical protein
MISERVRKNKVSYRDSGREGVQKKDGSGAAKIIGQLLFAHSV